MDDKLEQKIRERAYALWEQDGCPAGRHEDYWHAAERELREPAGSTESSQAEAQRPAETAASEATEAPLKKTRSRKPAAAREEAAPVAAVAPKRRRAPAGRVTSH